MKTNTEEALCPSHNSGYAVRATSHIPETLMQAVLREAFEGGNHA